MTEEKIFPPLTTDAEDTENDKTENLYFQKLDWLKEHGRTMDDVMDDGEGEYILELDEDGLAHMVFLPKELQNIHPK